MKSSLTKQDTTIPIKPFESSLTETAHVALYLTLGPWSSQRLVSDKWFLLTILNKPTSNNPSRRIPPKRCFDDDTKNYYKGSEASLAFPHALKANLTRLCITTIVWIHYRLGPNTIMMPDLSWSWMVRPKVLSVDFTFYISKREICFLSLKCKSTF
jgi:hypothetical protein